MTIFIYAREEIEQLIEKEFPTKTAVISFYDPPVGSHEAPPVDFCGKAGRLFQAAVWDIHYDELEDYGLRYEDYLPEAEKLADETSEQFDVSDQRTLDEVVNWLMRLGYIPSFWQG